MGVSNLINSATPPLSCYKSNSPFIISQIFLPPKEELWTKKKIPKNLTNRSNMLVIGLSWLVFWLLQDVFNVEEVKSALVTAIIFIILSLITEGVPNWKRA